MINLKKLKKTDAINLDDEIERLMLIMSEESPETERYADIADQLVKLYKLKEVDSKSRVSPDVLIGAAVNLIGILAILGYEHAHPLVSKAIPFVGRKL